MNAKDLAQHSNMYKEFRGEDVCACVCVWVDRRVWVGGWMGVGGCGWMSVGGCGWEGVGMGVCVCVKLTSTAPFVTQQNET